VLVVMISPGLPGQQAPGSLLIEVDGKGTCQAPAEY
jgi:hypothetical protein